MSETMNEKLQTKQIELRKMLEKEQKKEIEIVIERLTKESDDQSKKIIKEWSHKVETLEQDVTKTTNEG